MWTRWLMTTPTSLLDKAPWHTVIRLSNTQKHEDLAALGNRVLAIWVGKGFYYFTTYDKKTGRPDVVARQNYDDNLEGHWNFIYYSYKLSAAKAVGFVVFGEYENKIARIEFNDIIHNPLTNYARVRVGAKEFSYLPFNGMIYNVQLFFGNGYIPSMEQLKEFLTSSPKP
jgi:hypothetical protein